MDASQEPAGLSSPEAAARLAQFGLNEPASANRYSALREFASAFANPLVLILIGAAAVALVAAERHGIEMPIAAKMQDVFDGRRSPREAVAELMGRPQKSEH